ncbi:MAG: efflux RND transporter periplasmic adaptor subunit [bacterium]
MDKRRIIIPLLVPLVIGLALYWYFNIYLSGLNNHNMASGTIEAIEVEISSEVAGRIININYDEGDDVADGAVLVEIDTATLAEALNQARSTVAAAEAQVKQGEANYTNALAIWERNKPLYAQKIISQASWDVINTSYTNATQAYNVAKAFKGQADAGYAMANTQFGKTKIISPLSGTVLSKPVEVGELATPGMPVMSIANLTKLKLMVYVPEKYVGEVRLGQDVDVAVDSFPDKKFRGKVAFISDKAEFTPKNIQTKEERVTQVFGIKVEIDNPLKELKPGMPADANFLP